MAGVGKQKNNPAYGVALDVPGGSSGPGGGLNGVTGNYGGAAPGGPGTITFNSGKRDAASDIYNDPAFQQLRDMLSAQGVSDAAHLRGALQAYLIQFGSVPDLPSDVLANSGLDTAGTADLAANNPFSTLARLKQNYDDQQSSAKNQLAARGILSSGETGFQLGRLGQQQAGAQYDATNSLLGNIGALNDQFVAGRQAAANQLAQGAFTAESNAAANGGGQPGPSVTATWDPATGTYKDPSGNYYDQNGNPVALPPSNSAGGGYAPTSAPVAPPMYDPTKILQPGGTNAFA